MERRVLAALAASKPDPISTSALVAVLWPADPPRSANKVVQTNVLRLRTLLGPSTILTTEHGYRLADDVDVDADRFERAFVEARRVEHVGSGAGDGRRRAVRRPFGVATC